MATRSGAPAPDGITFTVDPVVTVRELKREDWPAAAIYLCGGGEFAGSLLGEIDRLVLKRNLVVLGNGIRLFGDADPSVVRFDLVLCRPFASGVVIEEYARITTGHETYHFQSYLGLLICCNRCGASVEVHGIRSR